MTVYGVSPLLVNSEHQERTQAKPANGKEDLSMVDHVIKSISADKREDNTISQPTMISASEQNQYAEKCRIAANTPYPALPTSMRGHTPLDRAYLRPLQQPLFDAEWFVPQKGVKYLPFFKNTNVWDSGDPKCNFEFLNELKSKHDTNLNQSGLLDYPIEFSILGFNAILDSKTSQADRDALLSNGALFTFCFGNRTYLEVPFENILSKPRQKSVCHALGDYWKKVELAKPENNPNSCREATAHEPKDDLIDHAVKLLEKCVGDGFYKFNLGRSALKIKPGEAFGAHLSWKKTPQVSRPVRILIEIIGLRWTPL